MSNKTWTINGKTWIGKTEDGEFVATDYIYQPYYSEQTADNQDYISCIGNWTPSELLPLTKKDQAFLEGAYEADLSRCVECDTYHNTDDYYPDFQYTEDGLVCMGCFTDYLSQTGLDDYVNKGDKCVPLNTAESLQSEGRLEFIERFIGGMVDGRGGRYDGIRVREGHPTEVLKELQAQFPKGRFIFSHDESGQFQTYFSVWQIPVVNEVKLVLSTLRANKSKIGIHLIEPSKDRIERAIEDAAKDGFPAIYVHRKRVKKSRLLRKVAV